MPDTSSTLASIDAATGCQQCEGPLGDSPSPDFCSQDCQTDYFVARSAPLVGYREPVDLAAHIDNQVELYSPETAAPNPWGVVDLAMALYGNAYFQVADGNVEPQTVRGLAPHLVVFDEIHRLWQDTYSRLAEQAAREAPASWTSVADLQVSIIGSGPLPDDLLDGLEWEFKPVPFLAEDPPPPVMAPVELDIEAIQRTFDGGYTTRLTSRRIDPRRTR